MFSRLLIALFEQYTLETLSPYKDSLKTMRRQLRYYLEINSPTQQNLNRYLQEQGWGKSRFRWRADFSDEHLQFNVRAAETLEYKHLLARLLGQYCPDVMPFTYCINDENWPKVLNQLASEHDCYDRMDNFSWILKPALLNNGKEIKIFRALSEIEQHFLSKNRLGGEQVLQHYLNPHLLNDRRKYSIRMFVILTNYAGSFLYPYGYYNVALHPFLANDFSDLRSHLTNEHLQEDESNVLQIPTNRFETFPAIYEKIKEISRAVVGAIEQENPEAFRSNKLRNVAIYGFDFMVDDSGRVWLLEANHGPCFPVNDSHPLQAYLYRDFWRFFIKSFVQPIALDQPLDLIHYSLFEKLSK